MSFNVIRENKIIAKISETIVSCCLLAFCIPLKVIIPTLFLRKGEGDILSVMLSHPTPLDEIQPNLVCNYSHEWGL